MNTNRKNLSPKERQEEFNKKIDKQTKFVFGLLLNITISMVVTLLTLKAMGVI